jgi:hypothetical protein
MKFRDKLLKRNDLGTLNEKLISCILVNPSILFTEFSYKKECNS